MSVVVAGRIQSLRVGDAVQVRASSARRLACAAWWSRHGSRAPRPARPARTALETPAGQLHLRASCSRARAPARGELPRAGRGAGRPRRDRAAAPGSPSRRRCTPACCSAPSRCPSTCASRAPSASAIAAGARRASSTSRCAARPRRDASAARRRGTTSTPTAVVIHTSGTTAAPRAGRADLRQLAVERARLGRRARRSTRDERWLCALPLSHVGGLSILRAQRDLRDDRRRARALRHRARRCARCASERGHARQPRRDDARAPARRGPARARRRCAAR